MVMTSYWLFVWNKNERAGTRFTGSECTIQRRSSRQSAVAPCCPTLATGIRISWIIPQYGAHAYILLNLLKANVKCRYDFGGVAPSWLPDEVDPHARDEAELCLPQPHFNFSPLGLSSLVSSTLSRSYYTSYFLFILLILFRISLCCIRKLHLSATMVEAARRRSRLLNLARSLNPLKTRKPLPSSPRYAAVEWLSTATEDQITTGHNDAGVSRSLDAPSRTLAAGIKAFPNTICPVCLNFFQELWNEEDRDDHEFDEPTGHLMPTKHVYRAATQGCSGCEIIAWVLEPYEMQLDGSRKKVRIFFDKWYYPKSGGSEFFKLEFYGGFEPANAVHAEITIRSTVSEFGKGVSHCSKD